MKYGARKLWGILALGTLVILAVGCLCSLGATDATNGVPASATAGELSLANGMRNVVQSTGIHGFLVANGWKSLVMILIGGVLLYLGVVKDFEPLLLVPIGFGTILVNVPFAGMGSEHGFLRLIFRGGIENEVLPLIVFMGIGALSDFGPLLANPRTAILGAAAQFGVFGTLLGVVALNAMPWFSFTVKEACAIAIIGAADGPTSIYVGARFAPRIRTWPSSRSSSRPSCGC
jgi:Na+-transporting methylmalonyl-CoA/oxaloacetate decarboxylase beta subunit